MPFASQKPRQLPFAAELQSLYDMKLSEFDRIAKIAFGEVLRPFGFECSRSRRCTFYRQLASGVYHFIVPDPSRLMSKYDVNVFPHHPKLDTDFETRFPDDLGIPTDCESYLARSGVGMDQEWFWCRTPEGFQRNFDAKVKGYLLDHAIPYLDRICDIEAIKRVVRRGPYVQKLEDVV